MDDSACGFSTCVQPTSSDLGVSAEAKYSCKIVGLFSCASWDWAKNKGAAVPNITKRSIASFVGSLQHEAELLRHEMFQWKALHKELGFSELREDKNNFRGGLSA